LGIIQQTYISFTTINHHKVKVLVKYGFWQPIEFDNATKLVCFGYDSTFLHVVKVGAIA